MRESGRITEMMRRLRRSGLALVTATAVVCVAGGGALAGCGSIRTYGGVEHSFGYDFDDDYYEHHHHHSKKAYKKYRKQQKKWAKAQKKRQKEMAKRYRKHHKHHHDDDD